MTGVDMKRTLIPEKLCGREDLILLDNPDRGFYFEIEYDVGRDSTMYTIDRKGPLFDLERKLALYGEDRPKLVKTYIHLNCYKGVSLDETALSRIDALFEGVRAHGLKAIVSFVYQYDIDGVMEDGELKYVGSQGHGQVDAQTVLTHIAQLKHSFYNNRDVISIVQMGFVGAWGEWALYDTRVFTEEIRGKIIRTLAESVPPEIYLAIRLPAYKKLLIPEQERALYDRIGFHCDSIFGTLDGNLWGSTGWDKGKEQWEMALKESPYVPVLGELFWGWWFENRHMSLDGMDVVEQLADHRYYTLNITHAYLEHEKRDRMPMYQWKSVLCSENYLRERGFPCAENYYTDWDGAHVDRTIFEYIRDHLGYRITLERVTVEEQENQTEVTVELSNDGFAVPFQLESGIAVFEGEEMLWYPAGNPKQWHSRPADNPRGKKPVHTVRALIPGKIGERKFGFGLRNSAGQYARTANRLPFERGINLLSEIAAAKAGE